MPTRPEPKTSPPKLEPIRFKDLVNTNCQYCNSRIFDDDRNCPSCGAPILNNKKTKEDKTFREIFKEIEECKPIFHTELSDNDVDRFMDILKKYEERIIKTGSFIYP